MERLLSPVPAAIVLVTVMASPLRAADPPLDDFRAKIDAVIGGLGSATDGILEWVGADPFEIRRDGDTLVAAITDARLTIHAVDAFT
jgi:hypothetical protein